MVDHLVQPLPLRAHVQLDEQRALPGVVVDEARNWTIANAGDTDRHAEVGETGRLGLEVVHPEGKVVQTRASVGGHPNATEDLLYQLEMMSAPTRKRHDRF